MNMILNHINKIRSHRRYANSFIYLYIEANMSYLSADMIAELVKANFRKVIVVSDDASKKNRPGVWTGEFAKQLYAQCLVNLLSKNELYFGADFVSVTHHDINDIKKTTSDQLKKFRLETIQPKDKAFGKTKQTFTGKGGNGKDDIVMALAIAATGENRTKESADFQNHVAINGWSVY